ncbi:hypothetical protein BCR33DRAFT_856302 [Rhizoclosmatium globosum]|uniref:DUF4097 domain-containing protein n=1 Tax=Rhizoclosmatium globosum TaxID=329046 RepID=A0A1Y2BEH4_9FUNG|nr:hypothetical protein BCR33DRAFT_856302 [Rhizoclosmatium globosum]|eukprot:ORY33238.1 hypothetical protein BCR33DRAFT_856302 [Rhizoclosmatium globosum]
MTSSAPAPAPPTRSRTVDLTLSGSAYFDVIVRKGAEPENGVQVRAVRTAGLHHYFSETKISIDSHEGKSAIRVTTPTFSNFAIGGWGDTLYLKIFITLNRDIEEFTCQGDLLQLSFEAGVHVSRVVDVKSRSGDVKIVSALNVETLALACGTGNITIENTVTTSKDITLQANNGIIRAARPLDARNLRVIAGTGPILLDNVTAAEEVNLESKAGGIEALEIKSNSFTASTDTNVATGALTGILSFSKVTTLNAVILQTNTGGISGQFVGYETLIGSAKFGAINITLTPGSGGSSTSLSTEFGAVDAVVKDYKGKFDAKGSTISIRGAGDSLDGNHQGIIHGIIRENHEKSNANISLRTMNGNVDVKFIQLSPTASSEPTFVAPPSYDEQA